MNDFTPLNERLIHQNLTMLLKDMTTGKNIMLAPDEEITAETLVLTPRAMKSQDEQTQRTRKNAEVFTPAWVCKRMNEALDVHEDSTVLEITCGEAPFIVSRYDAATGDEIPLNERVGILDYKLRLVNEKSLTRDEWLNATLKAFQSVYGYELQGDSLLLARINLLMTFIDYYQDKWKDFPTYETTAGIVDVITWNFWQMEGIKDAVPYVRKSYSEKDLFGNETIKHEPIKCKIRDWRTNITINYRENGVLRMKYDFCISNPPYQDDKVGNQKQFAPPIYHKFMDEAYEIADCAVLIHPARFLFNAGSTPKDWNEKMLNDPHFKVLDYSPRADKYFKGVDIKGGVAISIRDSRKKYGAMKAFTAYPELNSILHKVISNNFKSLMSIIYSRTSARFTDTMLAENPYTINRVSKGHVYDISSHIMELIPEIFHDEKPDDEQEYIKMLGRVNNKRVYKYIKRDYVADVEYIDAYKVFVPQANGSGAIGEVVSTPLVGVTETFITIGCYDNCIEAENTLKYVKTKFARTMLGILKVTQNGNKPVWKYVPLQNFTNNSDIDWTQSVRDIDQQLYSKYKLSDEEINFIESYVKEMN